MRREPLLIPASVLALGILLASFLNIEWASLLPASIGTLVLVLLSLFVPSAQRARLLILCCCIGLIGIADEIAHRQLRTPKLNAEDGETVLLSGCVTNPPVFSPAREQFTLNLNPKSAIRITVNLRPDDHALALNYGQRIEVPAKIRAPRNFQNPEAFDYVHYLAAQHIYWTGSVGNSQDIKVLPGSCGSSAVAGLYALRTWALGRIARLYPNDQHTIGLLQATLIGETSGVERRWTQDFRITGTYHALVISGQHVSVLAFTILLILRLFQLRKVPALCVATLASWLYAFISGMSSPVVSAAGGFTLFLIASYCFRKMRILNALAVVGIVYLLFDPDQLFDPSFQFRFFPQPPSPLSPFRLWSGIPNLCAHRSSALINPATIRASKLARAEWRVELRLLARTIQVLERVCRSQGNAFHYYSFNSARPPSWPTP